MNPGIERDKTINKLKELVVDQDTRITELKEQVSQLNTLMALLVQDRESSAWTAPSKNPDGTPVSINRQAILQTVGGYLRPLIAVLPPTLTRLLKGEFAPYVEALLTHMKDDPERHASWSRILELIKTENITPGDMGMRVLEDGTLKVVFGPMPKPLFGGYL